MGARKRLAGLDKARLQFDAARVDGKSLFEWRDVFFQYVGFLSSFGILGAIGFRYGILRAAIGRFTEEGGAALTSAFDDSARGAARIGLLGVALGVASLMEGLMKRAASSTRPWAMR
jgi:hypothetical protein